MRGGPIVHPAGPSEASCQGSDIWTYLVELGKHTRSCLATSSACRDQISHCAWCPRKNKYRCPHLPWIIDCVCLVKSPIAVFMANCKKVFLLLVYPRITQSPLNSYFIMTTIKAENNFIFPFEVLGNDFNFIIKWGSPGFASQRQQTRGMNPGTQESELGPCWGASPQPVLQMAWKALQKPFAVFFLSRLWPYRRAEHGFTSLGSRKKNTPCRRNLALQQISGHGGDPERKTDLWQGMGTSLYCPLSSKAPPGTPCRRMASPLPLPQVRSLSPTRYPHVPTCLQVSSLPYFSLGFFPKFTSLPVTIFTQTLSYHSHLDNYSIP